MKYPVYLFILLIIISCKSDDDSSTSMNDEFFSDYYTENIHPSLQKFKDALELQKEYTLVFQASKSDDDFKNMTSQWLVCAETYTQTEVYNFGLIKDLFFDIQIYNYPVNSTQIENNIDEETIYNTNYFSTQSTVNKGLATLEYLLFGNFDIDNSKTLLTDNSFRLDYALGVTNELIRQAELLISTWEDDYMLAFVNANENICSNNAKCLSINQIINVLDVAKVTKIGKPSGFENSTLTDSDNLEAYRSRSSLLLISAMLAEVKHLYFNSKANISSLVDNIDNSGDISTEIENKFNILDNEIVKFDSNLYDAINTNPELIRPIYDALKELNTLFAVDVSSILSVTVLPTDNDGD